MLSLLFGMVDVSVKGRSAIMMDEELTVRLSAVEWQGAEGTGWSKGCALVCNVG